MLMNNKFKAQTLTGNPTGNYRCQLFASRALNMSCYFSQSARSIESRCVVNNGARLCASARLCRGSSVNIFIQENAFQNIVCEMASICLGLNVLSCFSSLDQTAWHHALNNTCIVRFQTLLACLAGYIQDHDDVIKWKYFKRYWPFVRGIHRSPVNSSHKGRWCGASVVSLICTWTNGWANNRDAGDLIRHRAHNDITVMIRSV